jgi:predicted GNAT family acetyltransferase
VVGVSAEHHGLVFDTDAMLASEIGDYSKFYVPHGRFYLLRDAQAFVGVGALHRIEPSPRRSSACTCSQQSRGRGAARLLLGRLLDDARAMGFDVVPLESLKSLAAAHALYRSMGSFEVPPHDDNRMRRYQDEAALEAYRASTVFMALRLR